MFEFPRTGVIFFFFFLSKEDSLLERFSSVSTTFSSLLHSVDTYSGEEDYFGVLEKRPGCIYSIGRLDPDRREEKRGVCPSRVVAASRASRGTPVARNAAVLRAWNTRRRYPI